MEIQILENRKLIPHLIKEGVFSLFPLYVCQQKPNCLSPCIIANSQIRGCLVTGSDCGLSWIHPYWLLADNEEAARRLLEYLKERKGNHGSLNYSLEYDKVVQGVLPEAETTVDHLYILKPTRFQEIHTKFPIELITEELLRQVAIPDEMRRLIGSNYEMYNGIPFYGIVINNQLVTIAEAMCDTGSHAAIQQVYTAVDHRGQGLGKMIVSKIAADLLHQRKTPVYWVAESNLASIRLVEGLGFELTDRLGCLD